MKRSELDFNYPEELVALAPARPSRVLWVEPGHTPQELTKAELLKRIPPGDVFVVNETRVLPRRVFAGELEILFLDSDPLKTTWTVLFPSRGLKLGEKMALPGGVAAQLIEKGRPQKLLVSGPLDDAYFLEHGELPLPPYIQKARGLRHNQSEDSKWYQTAWATVAGSLAAPTASLHFNQADLEALRARGVVVEKLILHVGLGTFLPVTAEDLEDHTMHAEMVWVPRKTWTQVIQARAQGRSVWALGTTVTRALESLPRGLLNESSDGWGGETRLFLKPGSEWHVVNRLLTNFHQPESTLLALVASFSSLERVREAYQYAIQQRFRLFSYGDLSVWIK